MGKKQEKEQDLNIINPQCYKEKRRIDNHIWLAPIVVMSFVCLAMVGLLLQRVYKSEKSKLELEAYKINNTVNEEFSVALNSINLNGYMEVFEQYLKTTKENAANSIYYDTARKTLDNVTNISDNIVTTFVISFDNKAMIASGASEDIITNYDYENMQWYDYKKVAQNEMYVSNNFQLKEVCNDELFAIVRPIVNGMNDEPLGVVSFCYKEDYLNKVFKKAVDKKIDAVIYTDIGKVVLNTSKDKNGKTRIEENDKDSNYIKAIKKNEVLNWSVETYMTVTRMLGDGLFEIIIVLALFAVVFYVYSILVKNLMAIKVIDKKEKIVVEEEILPQEEKVEYEQDEYAIEDILGDNTVTQSRFMDDEVIVSGEIIYDKKRK